MAAEEEILKNGGFFAVSNRLFNREKAADDYHYYLDENCYAEDLGFDVVALNEHHGNPICMGSVMTSRPPCWPIAPSVCASF